jgi:hypothetical protein
MGGTSIFDGYSTQDVNPFTSKILAMSPLNIEFSLGIQD